jgi:hypothetical protein
MGGFENYCLTIWCYASETLPSERQGSNLILLVQQGIQTPEFLSSYEAGYLI